jgi:hypothetical protein
MGWVDRKWFPGWPGDYCSGWYKAPPGVEPIWELRSPDFHGTRNQSPIWVMVNGVEIPDRLIAETSGGSDCEIERYGKIVPYRYAVASHFCRTHIVFLYTEDHVLRHLKGNKSLFGQLVKEGIVQPLPEPPKKEPWTVSSDRIRAVRIEIPESLTAEVRAFLEPIVAANEKFVGLWKQGKTGPLVGAAMRAAAGKYEGAHIQQILQEIVGG